LVHWDKGGKVLEAENKAIGSSRLTTRYLFSFISIYYIL
jgi:hypothetical protein